MLNCIDPHGLVNPYIYKADPVVLQFGDCSDIYIFWNIYVYEEPTCSYIDSQEKIYVIILQLEIYRKPNPTIKLKLN
jgi:hypothetical protein